MAYSETILRRARARLDAERQAHDRENESRIGAIYARLPRLKEIDLTLRQTVAKVMAATFAAAGDPAEAMAKLKEENLALQRERDWILESEGIDEQDLRNDPICPACKGLGFVGERLCDCLQELCRQEQKKELSALLGGGKETFDAFKLTLYPNENDPQLGASPRELMQMVFTKCKRYAQSFTKKSPSLLFSGGTGLGKTFLSAAIARYVADAGHSVCYETASRVFADYESEKFGGGEERGTARYMACDLLILDDLGTEMTTQFTQSALYTLVNGRLLAGQPTILSTNLNADELRRRYSPQIASRLLGAYDLVRFFGRDIRMIPKNNG